jgi:hypothetical protein
MHVNLKLDICANGYAAVSSDGSGNPKPTAEEEAAFAVALGARGPFQEGRSMTSRRSMKRLRGRYTTEEQDKG